MHSIGAVTRRTERLVSVALLLSALALAHTQDVGARLGIIWRVAVLSWDSPATQMADEIATGKVTSTDPTRDARNHVVAGVDHACRLLETDEPRAEQLLELRPRVIRAPPPA